MTREERCQMAIEKGYKYNPETGEIIGLFGKPIKNKNTLGYNIISLIKNNKPYKLTFHQFGWYWVNKECVDCLDHINGIRNDNRICNLRSITQQENQWNRKKVKGYHFESSSNKWRAQIKLNGKKIYLGRFDNEDDARQAYLKAKETHHKINNPS